MEITGKIASVLYNKGPRVWTVLPDASVYDALQLMADHDIGALAVTHGGRVLGIFSERDYARKIILLGKSSKQTLVEEVMTHPATFVHPNDRVDECMRIMTHHRTRHVLVMDGGNLSGMVSIGDLVNWIISAQAETIGQLNSYIAGSYPA